MSGHTPATPYGRAHHVTPADLTVTSVHDEQNPALVSTVTAAASIPDVHFEVSVTVLVADSVAAEMDETFIPKMLAREVNKRIDQHMCGLDGHVWAGGSRVTGVIDAVCTRCFVWRSDLP